MNAITPSMAVANDVSACVAAARQREAEGDHGGALAAWQQAQAQVGFDRDNLAGMAHALRLLGRFAAAASILSAASLLFPDDVEIAAHHALVAGECDDWALAARRWSALLGRTELSPELMAEAARAHAMSGDFDHAGSMIETAIGRNPEVVQLHVIAAVLAEMRGAFAEALRRWDQVVALRPGDADLIGRRGQAAMKLAEEGREHDAPAASPAAVGAAAQPANDAVANGAQRGPARPVVNSDTAGSDHLVAILDRMESLGGDCEFGLLQRHYGLEPASLMRFSYSERLLELLAADLAPLDDLDHIELELEGAEYMVRDRRGYFWTHSFIYKGEMSEALLLKRQRARVSVLKRKLLAQLSAGDRLFVFKERDAELVDDKLLALSAQLRRFGPNRVLGFRTADAAHPPGTVIDLDAWSQVAYIGKLYTTPEPVIDTASWSLVLPAIRLPEAADRRQLLAASA